MNNLYFISATIVLVVIDIVFTIWYRKIHIDKNSSLGEKILDVVTVIMSCFVLIPFCVYGAFVIIESLFIIFQFYIVFIIGFLIFLLAILFYPDKQAEKIKFFIEKIIWNIEHKFNK